MSFWQAFFFLIAGSVTAWIGYAVRASQQKKLEVEKALEEDKRDLYKRFVALLFNMLDDARKQQTDVRKYERKMIELTRDMTIYASDEVLKLYIEFRTMAFNRVHESSPTRFMGWMGDIIVAIRKDLGHTMTKISSKDVLKTFITDVDKYPELLDKK